MKATDMKVGQRVRLVNTVHDDPPSPGKVIDAIPAGATGTVVALFSNPKAEDGDPLAFVKFDQHFETLNDWDNVLHVWPDDGEVTPSDFEII